MKITWVFTEKWCTVLRNIPGLKVAQFWSERTFGQTYGADKSCVFVS